MCRLPVSSHESAQLRFEEYELTSDADGSVRRRSLDGPATASSLLRSRALLVPLNSRSSPSSSNSSLSAGKQNTVGTTKLNAGGGESMSFSVRLRLRSSVAIPFRARAD